jgi:hypothetical protein
VPCFKRLMLCFTPGVNVLKNTPAAGKLSNVDLIALAGAHAVAVCKGVLISLVVFWADPSSHIVFCRSLSLQQCSLNSY